MTRYHAALLSFSLFSILGCGNVASGSSEVSLNDRPGPPTLSPNSQSPNTKLLPVEPMTPRPATVFKQAASDIDAILSDGEPHMVVIAFDDAVKARVRANQGLVKGKNGKGIVFEADKNNTSAQVNAVLSKYRFLSIETPDPEKSQAQLDQEEQEIEAVSNGANVLNRGSIVNLMLDDYTPAKAKALLLALQAVPAVTVAEVPPNL